MNEASATRRSACPGLYRLAPARDGFICRVKLALGTLTAGQARAIAAAARRHGSGVIDITSRANLQIRGLAAQAGDALADELVAAGLGAASAAADDVRNVMVSPSYGIDPQALLDTAPLARAILALLESRSAFHALSPKFSILIDGGESTAPLDHPHDIWLSAIDASRFAFGLAGTLRDAPLGWVSTEDALKAVTATIETFLAAAGGATRIRQLADPRAVAPPSLHPFENWRRSEPKALAHIGLHPHWVGARPPLGRLNPKRLEALAALAEEQTKAIIRLTPFQSVLLPDPIAPAAALTRLAEAGFITDAAHPLADLLACSGLSGCRSAHADTQADALSLAALGVGRNLHLSGCEKSCASARPAAHTLVAVAPGRYDLYRRAEGAASRFGEREASGLSLADAAARLADA